jgi:hypothetical protein
VAARPHDNRNRPLRLLGLLSLVALVIAYAGWRQEHYTMLDSAYGAIKTFSLASVYDGIGLRKPYNVALEVARWLGVVIQFSALGLLLSALFSERWALLRARLLFRDHVIVIGDTAFADRFGEVEEDAIIHLRSLVDSVEQVGQLIRLPFAGYIPESFRIAAAHRARAVLVATQDDARSISLAMAALNQLSAANVPIQVLVRVHDYWLGQRLHDVPGAEQLQTVSEPALAAREAQRRYPAYLNVADQGADRIHALLVGEPDWLEAMMAELLLSAGTLRFGRPVLTFACPHAADFRARLHARYPELDAEAELRFVTLSGDRPAELGGLHLGDVATPPLTAVYGLFPDRAGGIVSYLGLCQQARAIEGFAAPIFMLADTSDFDMPDPGARLRPLQPVPFGAHRQIVAACGLLSGSRTLVEQRYHEAYLAFSAPTGAAGTAWARLGEEYRLSNRRAVAHIPAKLFEAGFDLRGWMAGHDVWSMMPTLADGEPLCRDAGERDRLATLEHRRWLADRRLSGWRHGPTRDDLRKLHPDMKPFDQLDPAAQDYCRAFIDLLDALLPRAPDGMRRTPGG